MKNLRTPLILFSILLITGACKKDDSDPNPPGAKNFTLTKLQLDGRPQSAIYADASVKPEIVISFSEPLDEQSAQNTIFLKSATENVPLNFSFTNKDSTV